ASLREHWRLCDSLGARVACMGEALQAARLLRMPPDTIAQREAALQQGNWARHAPPPGAACGPPRPSAAGASTHGGWGARALERLLTGDATPPRGEATPVTPGLHALDGGLAFIEAQLYVPLVPLLYFVWVLVLVVLGSFDLPCRDAEVER
ncbi:unnamed protein product, partial [Prorocentrum cordatum]